MSNNILDFAQLPNGLKLFGKQNDYILETVKNSSAFYEQELLLLWNSYIAKSKCIFDIGANIGNHSLFWGSSIADVQIFSFEPVEETFALLAKNIEENNLQNTVHIQNAGVGEKSSFAKIQSQVENNLGATTLSLSETETEDHIKIVSIDEFIATLKIKPDFVKIDTEGWETSVLKGMPLLLADLHPTIWVEIAPENTNLVWDLLNQAGYVLVDIQGMNMLWVHPQRMPDVKPLSIQSVLPDMFEHIEKRYNYYGLYEKTKTQLTDANAKYREQGAQYNKIKEQIAFKNEELTKMEKRANQQSELVDQLEEQLNQQKEQLETVNHLLVDKKIELTESQNHSEELEKQILEIKQDFYTTMSEDIRLLSSFKEEFTLLQMQTGYLKRENAEYRRKIAMITDSLPGKIALKCYRLLKKIKNKIAKLFHKG